MMGDLIQPLANSDLNPIRPWRLIKVLVIFQKRARSFLR